jgi:hypothetical protein
MMYGRKTMVNVVQEASLIKRNFEFLLYPWGVYKLCFKRFEKQFGERNRKDCSPRGIYIKKV